MVTQISRGELKAALDKGEALVVIDTLPEPIFRKGRLPGAINIPSDDIIQVAPRLSLTPVARQVALGLAKPSNRCLMQSSGRRR